MGTKYWKSQGILSVRKSGNHVKLPSMQTFTLKHQGGSRKAGDSQKIGPIYGASMIQT